MLVGWLISSLLGQPADDHEEAYVDQDAEEGHDVVCKEGPDEAQPSVEHKPVYTLWGFCSPEILLSDFKLRAWSYGMVILF